MIAYDGYALVWNAHVPCLDGREGKLFRWTWPLDELLEDHPDVGVIVHSSWRNVLRDDVLKGS